MRCLHWTSFSEVTKGSVPLAVVVIIVTLRLPSFLDSTMPLSSLKLIICASLAAVLPSNCVGQVLNGEFNDQLAASPDWWYGHGDCSVVRTSQQANEGQFSALVSQRTQHWNGAGQELNGDLTVGKDYHFQCWVRTKDVPSGVVRIEISQDDDRGTRFFPVAKVLANDQQWTLLEGGFHFMVNGTLNDLRFIVGGDFTDDRTFDFYVDSVTITENDWKAAADQRIEQFRKRDVVIEFKDQDGNPISDIEVDVEQIGHRFAFGSTLNDGFIGFDVYRDFFKQNFEWATIEYYAQWKPVEEVQGVEVYDRADASVEFAEANGIKLRGHSLAWPDPRFVPEWLVGQSAEVHRAEINQRIDNVVSRYAGRLVHWDVVNEMLDHTYYQDAAGPEVRPGMFIRARENDPDVKLFTNEFGLTESGVKSTRYRELVQRLQAAGADVGGIGLQSHFDSNVSPKAMELTLAKLTDLGPEIWFTEFDVSNPDPVQRAELLETFYRYAFSVPEAEGIIMWGFWAGNHWRGADSAIVDQDFTINAAGKKYFELIDQWTTKLATQVSGIISEFEFSAFHGNYLVTTVRNGIHQHHVFSVAPQETGAPERIVLSLSEDPDADGSLVVYGTPGNDVFKFNFDNPTAIEINGVLSNIPGFGEQPQFTVIGGQGNDRLEVYGGEARKRFLLSSRRLAVIGQGTQIFFPQMEDFRCISGPDRDQIIFADSAIDDLFISSPEETRWIFGGRVLAAEGFYNLICRARNGNDKVMIHDSAGADQIRSDFEGLVLVRSGGVTRQFRDFEANEFVATQGDDTLFGVLPESPAQITASMGESLFTHGGRRYCFSNVDLTEIFATQPAAHAALVDVSVDATSETVFAAEGTVVLRRGSVTGFRLLGVENVTSMTGANDRLVFLDSAGNDTVRANSDGFLFSSDGFAVRGQGLGGTVAVARQAGVNTAFIDGNPFRFRLVGNWIEQ